jgi:hypothetical protein
MFVDYDVFLALCPKLIARRLPDATMTTQYYMILHPTNLPSVAPHTKSLANLRPNGNIHDGPEDVQRDTHAEYHQEVAEQMYLKTHLTTLRRTTSSNMTKPNLNTATRSLSSSVCASRNWRRF